MGEVVEVGRENRKLKVGDRIVVPFTILCGECEQCRRGNFSVCERSNRNKDVADKVFGHATAGLFGHTHLTGAYAGGQAEYVRVPFADTTHVKIPAGLADEQVLFLGDIFPTGWQAAVQCDIRPTDTVAIWGCGLVGQMTIRSAVLLGAKQVIAIDRLPDRLSVAAVGGAITLNFAEESVVERLNELTGGKRPETCIDAVGMEAHATATLDSVYDRVKQALMLESDRPHVLREMAYVLSPGRCAVDSRRPWRADRQGADGHDHEQGADPAHRPDPRRPLDRRSARANRGRPDRSLLRHHPQARARGRSRHVQDVPRQTGRLHQGRAAALGRKTPWRRPRLAGTTSTRAVAEGLGWFSIGLGPTELLAPRVPARTLGMESHTGLIQAYGAREIVTGIGILSQADPTPWIWGRVGGDVLDLATLAAGLSDDNPRRGNVGAALVAVGGVAMVDALCARALSVERPRAGAGFDYGDRRGLPLPPEAMRGAGRDGPLSVDARPSTAACTFPEVDADSIGRTDARPQVPAAAAAGINPGDEATPGTPGAGEAICPVCNGAGSRDGRACANCAGTGKIIEGIGGG